MRGLTFFDEDIARAIYDWQRGVRRVYRVNELQYAMRHGNRFEPAETFDAFLTVNRIALVEGAAA